MYKGQNKLKIIQIAKISMEGFIRIGTIVMDAKFWNELQYDYTNLSIK